MAERMLLTIEGMSCGHCVRAVDQALRTLPGVEVEQVEVGSAVVAYDPAALTPAQVEAAISEEGFTVRGSRRVE